MPMDRNISANNLLRLDSCPKEYEPIDLTVIQKEVLQKVQQGPFHFTVCEREVTYFFNTLGLHHYYFATLDTDTIAKHIVSLMATKVISKSSTSAVFEEQLGISLAEETADSAAFACISNVSTLPQEMFPRPNGVKAEASAVAISQNRVTETMSAGEKIEHFLEAKYLCEGIDEPSGRYIGRRRSTSSRISGAFLGEAVTSFRLQSFLSSGVMDPDNDSGSVNLRIYMLSRPRFINPCPPPGICDLDKIGDIDFLARASPNLKKTIQHVLERAEQQQLGPVIVTEEWAELRENSIETARLLVCMEQGSTHSYFTGIGCVYRYHGLFSTRKYVEFFSNGKVVYNYYLRKLSSTNRPLSEVIAAVADDLSLQYVLPRTSLTPLQRSSVLSPQEHAYAYCAWKFTSHFAQLCLGSDTSIGMDLGSDTRGGSHKLTEADVLATLFAFPSVVKLLFQDFHALHAPAPAGGEPPSPSGSPTPSSSSSSSNNIVNNGNISPSSSASGDSPDIDDPTAHQTRWCGKPSCMRGVALVMQQLDQAAATASVGAGLLEQAGMVLVAFLLFNHAICKTNFYKRDKIYSLNQSASPEEDVLCSWGDNTEQVQNKVAVHLMIGAEFRALYVGFRGTGSLTPPPRCEVDVVRAGSHRAFGVCCDKALQHTYRAAHARHLQYKEIAEAGAHATVLLSPEQDNSHKARVAYQKFVSATLDLLLPEDGVEEQEQEHRLLFLNPPGGIVPDTDPIRGTSWEDNMVSDLCEWACQYARTRGYAHWRAFNAGKDRKAGGLQMELHGMPLYSLRAFMDGLQQPPRRGKQAQQSEQQPSKVLCANPTSALGSFEMRLGMGCERVVALADSTGVLLAKGDSYADSFSSTSIGNGAIPDADMQRLASEKVSLADAREWLGGVRSSSGTAQEQTNMLVCVDDMDVVLPDGTEVESGARFRAAFHLDPHTAADFLVLVSGTGAGCRSSGSSCMTSLTEVAKAGTAADLSTAPAAAAAQAEMNKDKFVKDSAASGSDIAVGAATDVTSSPTQDSSNGSGDGDSSGGGGGGGDGRGGSGGSDCSGVGVGVGGGSSSGSSSGGSSGGSSSGSSSGSGGGSSSGSGGGSSSSGDSGDNDVTAACGIDDGRSRSVTATLASTALPIVQVNARNVLHFLYSSPALTAPSNGVGAGTGCGAGSGATTGHVSPRSPSKNKRRVSLRENLNLAERSLDHSLRFKYLLATGQQRGGMGLSQVFTPEALVVMEAHGMVVVPPAVTCKGEWLSHSYESLLALALDSDEYQRHVLGSSSDGDGNGGGVEGTGSLIGAGSEGGFYEQYVRAAQKLIYEHARKECECIKKESALQLQQLQRRQQQRNCNGFQKGNYDVGVGVGMCAEAVGVGVGGVGAGAGAHTPSWRSMSDTMNSKIVLLSERILLGNPSLYDRNKPLVRAIVTQAIPSPLLRMLGYDELVSRLPGSFTRSLFAKQLASLYYFEAAQGFSSSPIRASHCDDYEYSCMDESHSELTFHEFIARYDL